MTDEETPEQDLDDELVSEPPEFLRFRKLTVQGLFRRFDHTINLRLDERVTIIHGRNGVGKTLTLTLIDAFVRKEYGTLRGTPFSMLRIDFTDDSWVEIRQVPSDTEDDKSPNIETRVGNTDGPCSEWCGDDGDEDTLDALRARLRTYFIATQRLIHLGTAGEVTQQTVRVLARDMARRITSTNTTYAKSSLELDGSLPLRLFSRSTVTELTDDELQARTEVLERERERLRSLGLLEESTPPFDPSKLDPVKRAMFAVYLEDNETKLGVYRELADRTELLLRLINKKLAPKRLEAKRRRGYQVLGHDGLPLALTSLSSGEQHELVLLHELLFNVPRGALVLIDEPELSLHVTWQSEVLEDLLQIAAMAGCDVLVATHSPYIVGRHRELLVQLGEPEPSV